MTDKDIHDETIEREDEQKGCENARARASSCPCARGGGCPPHARPVCFAVVVGAVGVLAYRAMQRRKGGRR